MLPPIQIPDAAGRLSAMAQQATLAPIQQAAAMRGQAFAPPVAPQQPGLMAGLPALAAGVKDLAGSIKASNETDAMADFVRGAIGALPKGATPVEGLPWLDQGGSQPAQSAQPVQSAPGQQGGSLPPVPPMGGGAATPASAAPSQPPTQPDANGTPDKQAMTSRATANPLGFNERQVAILKGMIDSGSADNIRKASQLVMMKAFEAPPEAQSAFGKLVADKARAAPELRKYYDAMIAKETAPPEKKDDRTSSMKEYEYAVGQGFKGSFQDYETSMKKAGASNVSVNTGENAYAKERGKQLATARQEIADRAQVARGTRSRVAQASKLLEEVQTGAMAPTFQSAKRVAKALGFDLGRMGITDDVSAAENFQAITGMFLMDYIQQTKGAISEKENELFQSFSPRLDKTKEGNKMLLQWADGVAQREIDLNRLATKYEREHGQLDSGWEDVKARWQDEHPIVTAADVARAEKILGSSGADSMGPAAPGTSATLPKMGLPAEPGKLSDQELLEQLRKQGYPIPRTQ